MHDYKPHIDGLRAVAVLSVVVYHLGFGLPGGFVGVDVFFVISGFLISQRMFREIDAGTFSLVGFYERRARRILPAFFAVSAATAVAVAILSFPAELLLFGKWLIASVAFVPNVYAYTSLDYFASGGQTMPLLHYWSLGVEEQFYVVFPLLVMLIARFAWRWLPAMLIALIVASLAASEIMLRYDPPAAFYLLPFRAFELLIGSMLALPRMMFPKRRWLATTVTSIGLALVVVSVTLLNSDMRFPGLAALLPCIGSALVIWGSHLRHNPAASLLSLAPVRFIGEISYSLYLVHWPLTIFSRQLFPYANPTVRGLATLALSIALATASLYLVERPVRRNWTRRGVFRLAAGGVVCASLAGAIVISAGGFPSRLDARIQAALQYVSLLHSPPWRTRECFLQLDQDMTKMDMSPCLPRAGLRPALLWGDSHAAHLFAGLDAEFRARGYSLGQITASACGPFLGVDIASMPYCHANNQHVASLVEKLRPEIVIITGIVVPDRLGPLDQAIRTVAATGAKVILLGPAPLYLRHVPHLLVDRWRVGNHDPYSDSRDLNSEFLDIVEPAMKAKFAGRLDVRYISIMDAVCPGRQCPMVLGESVPIQFDVAHLTPEGSRFVARRLIPAIFE